MDKPDLHIEICQELTGIYRRKNHDYGDSFAQLRERRKDAILIRLFDKYLRLETLMDGEDAQVAESIDDTLKDMANYCNHGVDRTEARQWAVKMICKSLSTLLGQWRS